VSVELAALVVEAVADFMADGGADLANCPGGCPGGVADRLDLVRDLLGRFRGLAGELGATSTAVLLRQLLRINPGEAAGRVRAGGTTA